MDLIESLLDVDVVAYGILILITCHDKDLLKYYFAITVVYDVKKFHERHSQDLFC
jgi:hypothetical protein